MAELVFSNLGASLGGQLLPQGLSFLGSGIGGAALGSAIGASAGAYLDRQVFGPEIQEGPRLKELHLTEAREGAPVQNAFGRVRVGGQLIWVARFREHSDDIGGKGGPVSREYSYSLSFAVGIGAGPVSGISRIWANGEPFNPEAVTARLYHGTEDQAPDPLIEAIEGSGFVPGFRGLAYIVFEDLPMDRFGARIPQFSFEILRGVGGKLERDLTSVNIIPAAGEFVYSTSIVHRIEDHGIEVPENMHNHDGRADFELALDQLVSELPEVSHINLVVGWFGDDLRCGRCEIRPGVEVRHKATRPWQWSVAGLDRSRAWLVSTNADRPSYGGTPDDASVKQAIIALKERGLSVNLYPFLFMDIAPGNSLPDPYGDGEQSAYPWRGRISLDIAPDRVGTSDRSAEAGLQLRSFFGDASASDFRIGDSGQIDYSGPDQWRYRRFILHYAALGRVMGVDSFLIGSEMPGLTRIRDHADAFPAVAELRLLAAEARALLGSEIDISYAADWTEYGAWSPEAGEVFFPLDPLWADDNIDYVGIDWYAPMADWPGGDTHLDAIAGFKGPHDADYLASNIEGGEAYDWYYASVADREQQIRSPISDGAYQEDWIFRQKDIRNWWSNAHHERRAGVRLSSPTSWRRRSKPIYFVEFGCPAVDRGSNQPNVFYDPKSSESARPYFSSGIRDDLAQRRCLEALLEYWRDSDMLAGMSVWAWDARPFPAFPNRTEVWSDGSAWVAGHWLNGRAGLPLLSDIVANICHEAGIMNVDTDALEGIVAGFSFEGPVTVRRVLEPLRERFGFDVIERDSSIIFALPPERSTILDSDGLIAGENGAAPLGVICGDMESRAGQIRLHFMDSANACRPGMAVLEGEPDAPPLDISLPLVMDRAQALSRAREIQAEIEARSLTASFELSPARIELEAGDHILIDGVSWRLTRLGEGTKRLANAVRPAKIAPVVAAPAIDAEAIAPVPVRPETLLIDAPALPGEENDARPLFFAFAYPWTGAVRLFAGPDATALTLRASLNSPSLIGRLVSAAPSAMSGRWLNAPLEVRLPGGGLTGRTDIAIFSGANAALLETGNGWELLQYQSAELLESGNYRLNRLLRGQQGTESQAAFGAKAGARMVFLSGSFTRAEIRSPETGLEMQWRAVADHLSQDDLSALFTYLPIASRPWSPVHLRATRRNDKLSVQWIRRSRIGGDNWENEDVPLEGGQAYRLELWQEQDLLLSRTVQTSHAELELPAGDLPLRIRVAQIGLDGLAGNFAEITVMEALS